eukprot:CAMPEP_0177708634 /NCGR_PEP_ID=MMETSP0484_2-20121128/10380_1 /TAXON_ID=354590 /ORGANISM="Rhodomonas lens, Strain RHODO" /LENGTH=301 /DNA_ID=CAMNT_0019220209 /DNA_START=111 /DNA_END=1013 /DNA_ORIENTATION=-
MASPIQIRRSSTPQSWNASKLLLTVTLAVLCWLSLAQAAYNPTLRPSLRGGSSVSLHQEPERDFNKMKLSDLQKELRGRGLSTKGLKGELIQRLQENIGSEDQASFKRGASQMDAAPADLPEGFHSSQTKQPRFNEPTPLEEKNAEMVDNAAAAAAAAVPPSPVQPLPQVRIDDTNEVSYVKIYNSYAIKDKCRAAGFRWDVEDRAWIQPLKVLMEVMGEADKDSVTEERVLELVKQAEPRAATPGEKAEIAPGEGLKVEVSQEAGVVMVKGEGTYSSNFKWDRDSYAWARPLGEVETELK